jgi:hypothetical protein
VDSTKSLQKRVKQYLRWKSPERAALNEFLAILNKRLPDTVIFGGMLREFSLGNAREFASDMDLVSDVSREEIYAAIKDFSPTINKFDGFRFVVGKRRFDIWALEDTWAFREGLVFGRQFSDLFKTTFFNVDEAVFHLRDERVDCSNEYLHAIDSKTLEINLEPNPSPVGMSRRAINLAIENDLGIGHKLAQFILTHKPADYLDIASDSFVRQLEKHVDQSTEQVFRFVQPATLTAELTSQT